MGAPWSFLSEIPAISIYRDCLGIELRAGVSEFENGIARIVERRTGRDRRRHFTLDVTDGRRARRDGVAFLIPEDSLVAWQVD